MVNISGTEKEIYENVPESQIFRGIKFGIRC